MSTIPIDDDFLYRNEINSIEGLNHFLESRPLDEELGESLDLFSERLQAQGVLTPDLKLRIRAIHLDYCSKLFASEIPLLIEGERNLCDVEIIKEFYYEAEDVLYSGKLDEDVLFDFLRKYAKTSSPYVCVNIILALMRYGEYEKCYPFIEKMIRKLFLSQNDYWDNPGDMYAYSQLLYAVISLLENKGLARIHTQCARMYGVILEYCYLILTRVICWPEDKNDSHRNIFSDSEEYEDKISTLIKRAYIMLRHDNYFQNIVPSYSTPISLAVSDFSLAHDFSFATKKLGLKSQFKRDARNLYEKFEGSLEKPYNTAIRDGKRDSIELGHRFYIKYTGGKYLLSEKDIDVLLATIQTSLIVKKNMLGEKARKAEIIDYLDNNDIDCFYHFTERENIATIKKYGGLYSQRECITQAVPMHTVGDMRTLRDKDASFNLENYVRLSFCEFHPLIAYRQKNGADIVILKIKRDVAWQKETLFSDRDAALDTHKHGNDIEALKQVNMSAVKKRVISKEDVYYDRNQAEVMVHSFIPIHYILNINSPIEAK